MRPYVLALALVAIATACQVAPSGRPDQPAPADQPLPRLTLGWGVTPVSAQPTAVLWLADDLGFYAREGLAVDLVQVEGTPNLIAGMRAGQVDVGILTAYEAVLLTATQSLEMRMIGGSGAAGQTNTFMVVARDGVTALGDLRGKTFAIARIGSYDDALARQFLRARNVDVSEVQFQALGDPNVRLQALIAGRIDATLTSVSTWISIRQQPGIHILAGFDEVNQSVPSWPAGSVVTAAVARDKADQLQRFTRATLKASRYLASNRQAWVTAMAGRRPDMQPADLGELWDLYTRSWAVNGGLNLADYQKGADLLYQTSPDFAQVPRIELGAWTDARFVDAALREVGVDTRMDTPERAL